MVFPTAIRVQSVERIRLTEDHIAKRSRSTRVGDDRVECAIAKTPREGQTRSRGTKIGSASVGRIAFHRTLKIGRHWSGPLLGRPNKRQNIDFRTRVPISIIVAEIVRFPLCRSLDRGFRWFSIVLLALGMYLLNDNLWQRIIRFIVIKTKSLS